MQVRSPTTLLGGLLRRLIATLSAPKSFRVVAAVAFVAAATVLFLFQAVFTIDSSALIFLGVELTAAQQERIAPLLTQGLVYPVLALLSFLAASRAVRALAREHVITGALVGLFGALGAQGLLLQFPDDSLYEATAYAVFGTAGGALGGARGLDVRTRGASRERMNDAVDRARTPKDVLEAVGEHLALVGARAVYAWQTDEAPTEGAAVPATRERASRPRPWDAWECGEWEDEPAPEPGPLDHVPAPDAGALVLRPPGAQDERASGNAGWWPHPKADSTMYLALVDRAGEPFGVLGAAFAETFGGLGVRRAARREFAAAAQQASGALREMRLAVENREMGERLLRERFRGQLHDSALQNMNLAKMLLKRLRGGLPDGRADLDDDLVDGLNRVLENIEEASGEMRRLVRGGRPAPLEVGVPLPTALDQLAGIASKRSSVRAAAETTGVPCPLPPEVEDELYWAATEALNNVVKHSRANRAKVTLSYLDGAVALDVMDDGVGPKVTGSNHDRQGREGGDGLRLLRERVQRLGGTLDLGERPGGGTTFTARFVVSPA